MVYCWNITAIDTGPTLDISVGGDYYVEVTNTLLGCATTLETFSIQSTVSPSATLTPSKTAVCAGEQLSFVVSPTGDPNFSFEYLWDFGDGTSSIEKDPSHIFITANTYSVSVDVSYVGLANCGTSESVNIIVTDAVVPVINSSVDPICPGEESVLTVTGTYTTIDWNTSESGQSITIDNPDTYSITTMDANGCQGNADIIVGTKIIPNVTVFDLVTNEKDTAVNLGESIQMIAFGGDSYEWTPTDNLDNASISNPTTTPLSSIRYKVIGQSADLCTDSAFVNLRVIKGQINVVADNSFSPNGDSQFDTWFIGGIENYTECTIVVFDRRGRIVHEEEGYSNDWNGTSNGSELPAGTYF